MILRATKRFVVDITKTLYLYRYSKFFKKNLSSKRIISMIDGRIRHGGLCDRLCGIVSTYIYCKENNIDFRLFFDYPYNIENYLIPNSYEWRISESEISFNPLYSKFVYISMFSHNNTEMRNYAKYRLRTKKKQSLVYTNMYYFRNSLEFRTNFNELFKPSLILQENIKRNLSLLGNGKYVSLTFRFQQLLGDFKEDGFKVLSSEEEKKNLIEKCLGVVRSLYMKEKCTILVTSESKTFLKKVKESFDFVYVVPGDVVHVDFVSKNDFIEDVSQLKSFVDLYMIANADKVYLANFSPLYRSSFPVVGSWIYKKPCYEILSIDNNQLILCKQEF